KAAHTAPRTPGCPDRRPVPPARWPPQQNREPTNRTVISARPASDATCDAAAAPERHAPSVAPAARRGPGREPSGIASAFRPSTRVVVPLATAVQPRHPIAARAVPGGRALALGEGGFTPR